MNLNGSKSIWMVKSGDRILGPFSSGEIAQKLKAKELVVIDEVITPGTRWRFLRDEPQFASAIEEVRGGIANTREDTEIQGHTSNLTQTLTDPSFGPGAMSVEATLDSRDAGFVDHTRVVDADFVDTPADPVIVKSTPRPKPPSGVRAYGVSNQQNQESASGAGTAAWIMVVLVALGAGYFYWDSQKRSQETSGTLQSFDRINAEAQTAWNEGDFKSALSLYRQANRSYSNRPEVVSRLAPLMMQLEGQTVAAKRLLSDANSNAGQLNDNGVKGELEMGFGLAALFSEDHTEAESRFRSAISLIPDSSAARFNYGAVAFIKKDFIEASRRFSALREDPTAIVMEARSILAMEPSQNPPLKEAEAAVKRILLRHHDFRQEALVLDTYQNLLQGDARAAGASLKAALETDPSQTDDHWHDPFLYLTPVTWKAMLPMCREISEKLNSPSASALLGLCYEKAGDRENASNTISNALAQAPGEPSVASVNAYILMSAGRYGDARAALQVAGENPPSITRVLLGQICAKDGDATCAEQAFSQVINEASPPLSALTGLARLRLKSGDMKGAGDFANRALAMSPHYRPAILIAKEIKNR